LWMAPAGSVQSMTPSALVIFGARVARAWF
jgi:hypothetical protein